MSKINWHGLRWGLLLRSWGGCRCARLWLGIAGRTGPSVSGAPERGQRGGVGGGMCSTARPSTRGSTAFQQHQPLSSPEPPVVWLYLPSEFEMWIKPSRRGNYSSLSSAAQGLLSADRVMNPSVLAAALGSLQEKARTRRGSFAPSAEIPPVLLPRRRRGLSRARSGLGRCGARLITEVFHPVWIRLEEGRRSRVTEPRPRSPGL